MLYMLAGFQKEREREREKERENVACTRGKKKVGDLGMVLP